MNRAVFLTVSTLAVIGGVSAISIAQSAPPEDPYAAYYAQDSADPAQMQGGPLARPMPSSVKSDIGQLPPAPTYPAPTTSGQLGTPSGYSAPANSPYAAPSYTPPQSASGGSYSPPTAPQAQSQGWAPMPQSQSPSSPQPDTMSGATPQYYRGEAASGTYYAPPQQQGYPAQAASRAAYGQPQAAPAKQSWWKKLGFGNWDMRSDGHIKAGVAAVNLNDTTAITVIDGMVRTEISTVTQNQTEYGVSLKLRGQRDPFHRGFAGSTFIGDLAPCPPQLAGCASVTLAGQSPRAVRGHTGRVYTFGLNEQREHTVALEGAHVFIRSRYGDVTLGRDDGAAALFSLDTPSTLPMARASNLRTDYIGLDMTKTVNDASGFAEKVTYTSPRLLGDTIGVGVQFGLSYAPSAEACGVDYCVRSFDRTNTLAPISPEMEDVIEFGLALDRTFRNGLSLEGTVNYATATEASGIAAFDDLQSWGLGLSAEYGDWAIGTNYLSSNNGWAGDGDYTAYDLGLSWKPSDWGVTLGYGAATDDLAGVDSRSALLGVSYDWTEQLTFGTGVQYMDRDAPVFDGTGISRDSQQGIGLFFEGGFTF